MSNFLKNIPAQRKLLLKDRSLGVMSEKKLTKCLLLKIRSCDLILERFLHKQEFPVPKKNVQNVSL